MSPKPSKSRAPSPTLPTHNAQSITFSDGPKEVKGSDQGKPFSYKRWAEWSSRVRSDTWCEIGHRHRTFTKLLQKGVRSDTTGEIGQYAKSDTTGEIGHRKVKYDMKAIHWELAAYGLEGKPCHFNFYTSIIDLRLVAGYPAITNDTTEFILAWCSNH